MKIKVKAFAKINLMLDIINKRTDSYHELFMIMQSVGIYDTITVETNSGKNITITSNISNIPLDKTNIAWKAADAFFKSTNIKNSGVNIDIEKNIPHAAGLAGGSADGAAVLVALNQLFAAGLDDNQLCSIGVKIGADIPFCIKGSTLLAQGIGDILHKVRPLPKCHILLAKPRCDVSTGKAYAMFDKFGKNHTPDKFSMLCALQNGDLKDIASRCENVFEQFVSFDVRVEMKDIMRKNNALGVCMSGSGPTIFGIFENSDDAIQCKNELSKYSDEIFVTTPVEYGCKIVK